MNPIVNMMNKINIIPSDSENPSFFVGQDMFGSNKTARTRRLTNVEIYNAVGSKVPTECIKGRQCIRDIWRIELL